MWWCQGMLYEYVDQSHVSTYILHVSYAIIMSYNGCSSHLLIVLQRLDKEEQLFVTEVFAGTVRYQDLIKVSWSLPHCGGVPVISA